MSERNHDRVAVVQRLHMVLIKRRARKRTSLLLRVSSSTALCRFCIVRSLVRRKSGFFAEKAQVKSSQVVSLKILTDKTQ